MSTFVWALSRLHQRILISKGAGCMGCRDVAPKIDLSKIPAAPVAGQCYPYTVTCPSCAVATGHVCFNAPCTITSAPFTVCSGVTPTTDQIKASGKVTCSCDTDPAISDPIRVGDHWEYTITCQSQCGPATAIGRVNIDAPCDVSIDTAFPIANCADHALPTPTEVIANGGVRCGCGVTPDITNIQWIETPPEGNLWVGTYTATCKSLNGCESSDTGQFTSEFCDKFNCLDMDCNDGNVCTDDSCDPNTGCQHTDNTASCDDNNACTVGDVCADGACTAGTTPLNCDDSNVCTTDSCDQATGCQHTDNTAPCDDGNACTVDDVCAGGKCTSGTPLSCDDGNVCTDDSCNSATGCVNTANTAPCDDGNACTENDVCANKVCTSGPAVSCDDGNVCTDDSCNPATGCVNAANTAKCDDGDACTVGDVCANKECTPGTSTLNCNDNNICTDDSCDQATGCVNTANSAPCNDGNACTVDDVCANKVCTAGTPRDCDDGNVCTTDSCNTATGCVNAANTVSCDDGNACTVGDKCANKVCKSGTALNCDDSDKCTTDSCDPATGCQHDSKVCTDNVDCTVDTCNPSTGVCVYTPNDNLCNDGIACTDDACTKGCGRDSVYHCENTNNCNDGNKKTCCGATGLCVKKCSDCTNTNTCIT